MTKRSEYDDALAIANHLANTITADMDQTVRVSISSLASIIVQLAAAKARVTDLQASNTALLDRARAAVEHANMVGEDLCEELRRVVRERDEALSEARNARDVAGYNLRTAQIIENERDALKREIAGTTNERDEARAAAVRAHDALTLNGALPPELARLYRASRQAWAKWGEQQVQKLVEECGEYIAEASKTGARRSPDRIAEEAVDVLTVALSLLQSPLVALSMINASAERLEKRFA